MTKRMLDSRVWTNNRFGQMPAMARLLLLGIINLADDQGRLMAHPIYLRSQIFAWDDVAIDDIHQWLRLFVKNGTIAIYQVDERDYIQLLNWWDYQSLQYPAPSEYPALPDWKDRIRYNAKGGIVLTYNWVNVRGERLPDTCDPHGNPVRYSSGTSPVTPPTPPSESLDENPLESPHETPSGIPSETPLEAPIQLEDQYNDSTDQSNLEKDEEDPRAGDPVEAAWLEHYHEKIPKHIIGPLTKLKEECSAEAIVYGIVESVDAKKRTFGFIEKCARNYIPPAPIHVNGNGSYRVDLPPGVHMLEPAERSTPPPPLPPPMTHDDPWAVALKELLPSLSTQAKAWLEHSELVMSEIAGEPLCEILVSHPEANLQWLIDRTEPLIRKKLASLLRKRVNVAFVQVAAVTPTVHFERAAVGGEGV